jgi:hypothetical protein
MSYFYRAMRNTGILEYWNTGILEYWNTGILEDRKKY